jgi:hypothetical protein
MTRRLTREQIKVRAKRHRPRRFLKRVGLALGITIILAGGASVGIWKAATSPVYPPTEVLANHAEYFPPQRILTTPISDTVQSHIMEHGSGPGGRLPGIILQYNCQKLSCEEGLVDALREIAEQYPSYVYLAPYPPMDAQIALTTRGKLEMLETFDRERITSFIRANMGR